MFLPLRPGVDREDTVEKIFGCHGKGKGTGYSTWVLKLPAKRTGGSLCPHYHPRGGESRVQSAMCL